MRTSDAIRRAGRSLRQAKIRTLLTSLAIAVGAFTIMLSLAAGQGARQYADKLIASNVDPDALFIVKDKSIVGGGSSQSGLHEYDPDVSTQNGLRVKQLTQKDVSRLEKRQDLKDIRPIYDVQATYLQIEGFSKKYSSEINVYNPDVLSEKVAGTLPALGTDIDAGSAVIPSTFADTLKVKARDLVGKKITLTIERTAQAPSAAAIESVLQTQGTTGLEKLARKETKRISLRVAAVVKPSQLSFTPSTAMLIPISTAKEIAEFSTKGTDNYQKYFAATAKVKGDSTPAQVKQRLEKLGFYPQTADDLQGFLFTIINVILGIVMGFGIITLFASVFGIINTQYISVLERTSQIGLMKALGMRGRHVSRLFRYEAAWIGFLGGVIGVGLAWLLGTALNPWITQVLDLGKGTRLLQFVPWQAAGLVAVLIAVAIIAGYFPARKAAKLDPIEALRTE
jgi:putative ABC transport system permease protein